MCGFGSVICRTAGGVCAPAQRADEPSSKSALGRVASRRKHVSSYAVVVPLLLGLALPTVLRAVAVKRYRLASRRVGGTALVNPSGLSLDIDSVRRRSEPLRIESIVPELSVEPDWESIDALTKRMWPQHHASFGVVLHALQAFQPGCQPPPDAQRPTLDELRSVMLDPAKNKEWFRGEVSLSQTPGSPDKQTQTFISSIPKTVALAPIGDDSTLIPKSNENDTGERNVLISGKPVAGTCRGSI